LLRNACKDDERQLSLLFKDIVSVCRFQTQFDLHMASTLEAQDWVKSANKKAPNPTNSCGTHFMMGVAKPKMLRKFHGEPG
jgi:hypothetical protein